MTGRGGRWRVGIGVGPFYASRIGGGRGCAGLTLVLFLVAVFVFVSVLIVAAGSR